MSMKKIWNFHVSKVRSLPPLGQGSLKNLQFKFFRSNYASFDHPTKLTFTPKSLLFSCYNLNKYLIVSNYFTTNI